VRIVCRENDQTSSVNHRDRRVECLDVSHDLVAGVVAPSAHFFVFYAFRMQFTLFNQPELVFSPLLGQRTPLEPHDLLRLVFHFVPVGRLVRCQLRDASVVRLFVFLRPLHTAPNLFVFAHSKRVLPGFQSPHLLLQILIQRVLHDLSQLGTIAQGAARGLQSFEVRFRD